jgi:hypothetical protein
MQDSSPPGPSRSECVRCPTSGVKARRADHPGRRRELLHAMLRRRRVVPTRIRGPGLRPCRLRPVHVHRKCANRSDMRSRWLPRAACSSSRWAARPTIRMATAVRVPPGGGGVLGRGGGTRGTARQGAAGGANRREPLPLASDHSRRHGAQPLSARPPRLVAGRGRSASCNRPDSSPRRTATRRSRSPDPGQLRD